MGHYKSNVRDQVFTLFDVLGLDKALGAGSFSDLDADTAKEMISEMARLAEGPVAESFADGDRNPPVFDPKTHTVKLPESFKKSVKVTIEGGWNKVSLDEELGGVPAPPKALLWALNEHILGATRPCGCTPAVRRSRRSSRTTAPKSRRSGPSSPLSATGAPPWC